MHRNRHAEVSIQLHKKFFIARKWWSDCPSHRPEQSHSPRIILFSSSDQLSSCTMTPACERTTASPHIRKGRKGPTILIVKACNRTPRTSAWWPLPCLSLVLPICFHSFSQFNFHLNRQEGPTATNRIPYSLTRVITAQTAVAIMNHVSFQHFFYFFLAPQFYIYTRVW